MPAVTVSPVGTDGLVWSLTGVPAAVVTVAGAEAAEVLPAAS